VVGQGGPGDSLSRKTACGEVGAGKPRQFMIARRNPLTFTRAFDELAAPNG
jgi:hypothetical protein